MQSVLSGDIRIDLAAFSRNDDGTWTVLEDTKVRSHGGEYAHTLLLLGGTLISEGMFFANETDLVTILEQVKAREARALAS